MTHNALKSLYGAPKNLAGNVGRKRAKREQTVETPDWVIDAARRSFRGAIVLDPCAHPDYRRHFAVRNYVYPDNDGLKRAWDYTTYFNPPFDTLEHWLRRAKNAAQDECKVIGLFPFRPHRRWFFDALKGAECVFLHYDVKFKGHKTAFPAPLVLCAWNCSIADLGARETHRVQL